VPDYRCYLLGLSGSILAVHEISCADDPAGIAKAYELFHPNDFEVWRRDLRIYPTASTTDRQDSRAREQGCHWRSKAEECRAIAEQMQAPMAKMSFRRMAETYDRMADGLDERATELESPAAE
jgi:hypothetical protein